MISRELKDKWIAALRSGMYRQGKSRLKDLLAGAVRGGEPYYSCLGVLAELAGIQFHSQQDYRSLDEVNLQGLIGPFTENSLQRKLSDMNDGDSGTRDSAKSFREIADWIEANVPCASDGFSRLEPGINVVNLGAPFESRGDNVVRMPTKTRWPEIAVSLTAPGNQDIDAVTAGIERAQLALPGTFLVVIWVHRVTAKARLDAIAYLLSFDEAGAAHRCASSALDLLNAAGARPETTAKAPGPQLRRSGVAETARASVCIRAVDGQSVSHVSAVVLGPFASAIVGAELVEMFSAARERNALRRCFANYGSDFCSFPELSNDELSAESPGTLPWVVTQLLPLVDPQKSHMRQVEERIMKLTDPEAAPGPPAEIPRRDGAEIILESWVASVPSVEREYVGESFPSEEAGIDLMEWSEAHSESKSAPGEKYLVFVPPATNEEGATRKRVLYFREAPHDTYLVFVPPRRALFVDQIHRAITESKTWGEFRARLPAGERQRLFGEQSDVDHDVIAKETSALEPADEVSFESDGVPGYADGDYPPWLALEQELHVPMQILKKFATWEHTFASGTFCRIDFKHTQEIVAELRKIGYHVERRDDLMFW